MRINCSLCCYLRGMTWFWPHRKSFWKSASPYLVQQFCLDWKTFRTKRSQSTYNEPQRCWITQILLEYSPSLQPVSEMRNVPPLLPLIPFSSCCRRVLPRLKRLIFVLLVGNPTIGPPFNYPVLYKGQQRLFVPRQFICTENIKKHAANLQYSVPRLTKKQNKHRKNNTDHCYKPAYRQNNAVKKKNKQTLFSAF